MGLIIAHPQGKEIMDSDQGAGSESDFPDPEFGLVGSGDG